MLGVYGEEAGMNEEYRGSKDRKQIAGAVIILSGFLLAIISVVFVSFGGPNENIGEAAEKVFAAIIPLIGTWVGTVLAYYFSGENFERATDSVTRIASQVAEERLQKTSVVEAMIPIDIAILLRLPETDADGASINLEKDILGLLSGRITRVPILDHNERVKFVLHESLIFRFIAEKTMALRNEGQAVDVSTFTLKDLLGHGDNQAFASRTIGFVRKGATLAEAKEKMEVVNKCQDIFVTEDGTAGTAAVGWITNAIVSTYSRA